jgi:hypothetical protein
MVFLYVAHELAQNQSWKRQEYLFLIDNQKQVPQSHFKLEN